MDYREPLDLDYNLVKNKVTGGFINPEHQTIQKDDFSDLNIAPGAYDPNFNFVKPRVDIQVQRLAPLNPYNDRTEMMNLAKKDATDFDLEPIYDFVKKRAPAVKISKKVELEGPANIPDKYIFKEQWKHYDVNLDAYKENGKIGGKFAAENLEKFKLKEKEKEMLINYLNLNHRVPDPGFYEPIFQLIESGVPVPKFERYLERSRIMTREEVLNTEADGDMLVLEPERPRPHMGGPNFDRGTGREEKQREEMDEELFIEKNYGQIDKHIPNIKMVRKLKLKKN